MGQIYRNNEEITSSNIQNYWFKKVSIRPSVKSVYQKKYFFLFLNQNICCGYSKEPSQ